MSSPLRSILAVSLLLIGLAAYMPIVRLHGPYPLALVLPGMLLKMDARPLVAMLAPLVFWLSSAGIAGKAGPPRISTTVGAVVTIISVIYIATRWQAGLGYQGPAHTVFWTAVNGLAALCFAATIAYSWSRPGGHLHLLAHFILVGWIFFLALPYLGVPPGRAS